MKTPNLDKVLKNHFQYCRMHQYSLMEERYCSCGVEAARTELEMLKRKLEELEEKWKASYTA